MDEAFAGQNGSAGGFEPVKVAIPLATGGAVHAGLASLLTDVMIDDRDLADATEAAVRLAIEHFRDQCAGRSLDLDALESQSFVFNEQLALTEALVRLAGTRVIPRLLELYEVLEVERLDCAPLVESLSKAEECSYDEDGTPIQEPEWSVLFRSIPDALVRSRADGDLYVISWKTTSEYSAQRDQDARTDTQGLSEAWALEARLRRWTERVHLYIAADDEGALTETKLKILDADGDKVDVIPSWFLRHIEAGCQPSIRGVQMIYLVKGPRPKDKNGVRVQTTPLIRGLRKSDPTGLLPPEFATERFYQCTEPHPFKYAKGGQCPGNANHKRGEDWSSFNAWETDGGVRGWMELLARGGVGGAGLAALDSAWVMPVPHFRTSASVKSWERQTRAAESRHARDLMLIREYETGLAEHPEDGELWAAWNARLDEVFPQTTERCGDWFHRRCPAWELCHGAPHVAQDPVGSGLYQLKTQYQPAMEEVNG